MDRVNDDALIFANADDALARHRSALGREPHRRIEVDAAQRQAARVRFARHAEHEIGCLGNPNQPLSFWGTAGPALRSSLKFGNTARTTSVEKISPRPTPMNTSSIEARAKRGSTALEFRFSEFLTHSLERALDDLAPEAAKLRLRRLAGRAAIAARARPVTTTLSHAAGGEPPSAREISTSSPLCKQRSSGAMRPLILHPTAELPTSVWTA